MNPPSQTDETLHVIRLVADTQVTNYVAVSALMILLFDHALTFREEVELMWERFTWTSAIRIFYFWNRYFSDIGLCLLTALRLAEIKSDAACRALFWLEGTIAIVIIGSIDSVLALRVWILYDRNRRLLLFLVPLIITEMTSMLLIDQFLVPTSEAFEHIGPILPGCQSKTYSRLSVFFVVPPLIVVRLPNPSPLDIHVPSDQSFAMFVMTIYRCITTLRTGIASRMPITSLFLRDGVFWFVAVLIAVGGTIVSWFVGRPTLLDLMSLPTIVVFSVIASHTLLNMKRLLRANTAVDVLGDDYDLQHFHPASDIFRALEQLSGDIELQHPH